MPHRSNGRASLSHRESGCLAETIREDNRRCLSAYHDRKRNTPGHGIGKKHQGYCLRTLPEYIYRHDSPQKYFPETGCQQRPRSHPSCTPLGPCRRCGILHLNSVFLIKEDSPQKHTAQSKDSARRCQEAIQRYSCLHIPAAGPAAGLQRQPLPTKYQSASLPAKKVHVLSG